MASLNHHINIVRKAIADYGVNPDKFDWIKIYQLAVLHKHLTEVGQ